MNDIKTNHNICKIFSIQNSQQEHTKISIWEEIISCCTNNVSKIARVFTFRTMIQKRKTIDTIFHKNISLLFRIQIVIISIFFFFVMISQWLLFYTDFRISLAIFFWHHQRTYRLYHSQSRSNSFVFVSFDSTFTSLYQVLFWFRVFDNNFALHHDLRFSMFCKHRCKTSML